MVIIFKILNSSQNLKKRNNRLKKSAKVTLWAKVTSFAKVTFFAKVSLSYLYTKREYKHYINLRRFCKKIPKIFKKTVLKISLTKCYK